MSYTAAVALMYGVIEYSHFSHEYWQDPRLMNLVQKVKVSVSMDVIILEQVWQTLEGQVKAAEWRAAIAGDEGGSPQASASVRAMLVHAQPDERLDTAEVDLTLFLKVLIHQ
jgi:hypothetical protein